MNDDINGCIEYLWDDLCVAGKTRYEGEYYEARDIYSLLRSESVSEGVWLNAKFHNRADGTSILYVYLREMS
jgi:hypothetical protein